MAGILGTETSVIGNVNGVCIHWAVSTENAATTNPADTDRLVENGGSWRVGDVVIVSTTDTVVVGKVGVDGVITPMA